MLLGTYPLTAGQRLDTPGLRLLVEDKFIPERVGSTRGEHVIGMEAQLVPDVDHDGVSSANTVDSNGLGVLLIGTYRVTITAVKSGYSAAVEDLGCPEPRRTSATRRSASRRRFGSRPRA